MIVWLALFWFYDYRKQRFGATFGIAFGTNALFAYVLSWVLMSVQSLLGNPYMWFARRIAAVTTPEWGALLASIMLVGTLWCVIYPLYRNKIFIKL